MSLVQGIRNKIQRMFRMTWDVDYIQNGIYNNAAGSQKSLNIEPVVKSIYTANLQVDFGAYIKVAAGTTSYDQACVGKAFSASSTYRIGDVVTQGGNVYVANFDIKSPKAFDSQDWKLVAPESITGIPVFGGATVCTGKYHNSISVNGFLIDDDSFFGSKR